MVNTQKYSTTIFLELHKEGSIKWERQKGILREEETINDNILLILNYDIKNNYEL